MYCEELEAGNLGVKAFCCYHPGILHSNLRIVNLNLESEKWTRENEIMSAFGKSSQLIAYAS